MIQNSYIQNMDGKFQMNNKRKVIFVGLVCVDIMTVLHKFPNEDSESRCIENVWQRGGNASNSSSVFSLLGGDVEYFGTFAVDSLQQQFLQEDFKDFNIYFDRCVKVPKVSCPLSVVLLSRESGSRTTLHTNKNLPELTFQNFQERIDLMSGTTAWIHFEGRDNACEIAKMLQYINNFNENLNENHGKTARKMFTSLEAEKLRLASGLEMYNMWTMPDVMFVSKDFSQSQGYTTMQDAACGFFHRLKPGAVVICAWGESGAAAMSSETGLVTSPAFPPETIIDTCGAGDTFNAASIFALSRGGGLKSAITFGCKVAGAKCGMMGYKGLKRHPTLQREAYRHRQFSSSY